MSQYVDESFQRITDTPCKECKFSQEPQIEGGVLRCIHHTAIQPVTGIADFAFAMRNDENLCGIAGKLWQGK